MKKIILSTVCLGAASAAFAFNEVKWKTAQNGEFTEGSMWTKAGGPVSGVDRAVFDLDANYTVTFPEEATSVGYSLYSKTPYNNNPTDSKRLTLDFKGPFTFLDNLTENIYEGEPFKFYTASGHFFNWEGWNAKYGPALIDGAKVQLWVDKDDANKYATHITVSGGTFNMREEHDDGKKQCGKVVIGHTVPDNNKLDVVFTDGGESRFCNVEGRFHGAHTRYIVEKGAKNYVHNDFDLPNATDSSGYTNELIVRGAETYMQVGNMRTTNGSVPNRHLNTVVTNNATLKIGDYRVNNAGHVSVKVADGGLLQINSFGGNFLKAANSDTTFDLQEGGTLEITGNAHWGTKDTAENCTAQILYNGGTLKISNNFNWSRDLPYTPGLKIVNNYNWYLSSATIGKGRITMDLSDGDITGTGSFNVGNECPITLEATNETSIAGANVTLGFNAGGTTDAHFGGETTMTLSDRLLVGNNEAATLTIDGDATVVVNSLYVGYHAPGTLLLKDNAHVQSRSGNPGFEIGGTATGILTIRDNAVFDGCYTRLGRAHYDVGAQNMPEAIINIEGGQFVCTNNQVNVCDAAMPCTINLTGGEFYGYQLAGWGWSHWLHPEKAGWAKLVGNGGKIRASRGSTPLIGRFDEAVIGAQGLTIESDYETYLQQTFTNVPDESGVLTLTGSGIKRVRMNNWDGYVQGRTTVDRTAVAGGTLAFDQGADWYTHLIVTNNAVVSFAGGNTGMTLKGLTLGDETTSGTLELDPNDQLVVDGPVSIVNGRLAFTSNPGNAAYNVLTVKNPAVNFPEAQRVQWQRLLISAGHQAGHSYIYSTSTNASGDLVLTLTVGDPIDLTGDVTWTAEAGTWSDGDNWSTSAKPGTLANANVESEATIELTTDETIGKLSLSADATISGTGSLGFSDSANAKIVATDGTTTLDAGVFATFPLPVVTTEGAKVALGGALRVADLEKSGDGNLTLKEPTIESLTVQDGVVTFAGAANQTVSKLTLNAAANNRQVGLKTDRETVVSEFVPTKGLIVKAGAEKLTIESNKTFNFAPAEGPSGNNAYTTPYVFSETGPVTQAGAAVVVTEGNLTLKGTGETARTHDAPFFANVHNLMIGVREKLGSTDPSVTLDGIRFHADKHTRIGAAYDKDTVFWNTASLLVDNGAYARFDTLHVAGDIGTVDFTHRPVVNITVDHGSSLQAWYSFNMNNSGFENVNGVQTAKALVNVLFDNGSSYVDYNGNNGIQINNPGIDMIFDHGSIFGRTPTDWQPASIPGQLTFGGTAFDSDLRFKNGSRFMCDQLRYHATADWATVRMHFDDSEWTVGDKDFDFCFKYGNRIAVTAEGNGLKLNPPAGRTWTMHQIVSGTDIVKGGEGKLVFDVAKYYNGNPGEDTLTANAANTATLAITGTLKVTEGTVEIADATAVADKSVALDVAEGAVVDLGGNTVAFTTISGKGTIKNGSVSGTLVYGDGSAVPTFERVTGGTLTVDFGATAENPIDVTAAMNGIVIGHYTGTTPPALTFGKPINTGLTNMRATVSYATNGDIVMTFQRAGFMVFIL